MTLEHIQEGDYSKNFPPAMDNFPTVINEQHYIDAWLLNTVFNSILAMETYLIAFRENIEAAPGSDIISPEGALLVDIPAANYPPYKSCLAWDSNLLEENIKIGVLLFGVLGTLAAAPFVEPFAYSPPLASTATISVEVSHV